MKKTALFLAVAAIGGCSMLESGTSGGVDWSKVPAKTVLLFYPGQSSYEWLRSDAHKNAAAETRRGDACTSCHDDLEDIKSDGEKIVAGNPLEPRPVKGKNPHVDLKVQAAYDDKNVYLRFQWKTQRNAPGIEYPYYRFDGKEWKVQGFPKLDQVVQEGKQPGIYEDRLSLMLDDGRVPGFDKQGCWLTCHDGERDMPKLGSRDEAQKFLKKADVRKYLPASRTDPSDWRTIKSAEELAKVKADGGFADLIQWRAHRSNPVGAADDGFVLEYRNFDAGRTRSPRTWTPRPSSRATCSTPASSARSRWRRRRFPGRATSSSWATTRCRSTRTRAGKRARCCRATTCRSRRARAPTTRGRACGKTACGPWC
jgi:hypothetical protein